MWLLRASSLVEGIDELFVPVNHRQHRWQMRVQHIDRRADHPIDHRLAVQDLGHLKTQFAIVFKSISNLRTRSP